MSKRSFIVVFKLYNLETGKKKRSMFQCKKMMSFECPKKPWQPKHILKPLTHKLQGTHLP